ncbi:bifunctional methylenetetrahydrofolate dehydrogenase/methenyltetrahydrofolate cyclohydrolase FolD [Chungangia koreensis]|uniref:Bifunctional protein FolD n=1 Tax=Chungangia koreensis TaxID=752657 RepID=A0ABV8XAK7_9LACT
MSAELISGKTIGEEIRQSITQRVDKLKELGVTPGLAVVLVGNDPASHTYVTNKQKTSKKLGMHSELIEFDESISQEELLNTINRLNTDDSIHGILVQLPLPEHIEERAVIAAIDPSKDVDGFHPINAGKLMIGEEGFIPCTPFGIMKMIEKIGFDLKGKHAVVIGRSNIVGKPIGQLLLQQDATVTYCHSKTVDLPTITKQADLLVAAVGRPKMITSEHVKEGAVVIDVGINRDENNKLCGDVDFDDVKEIASAITPVPGGVGPMTITMLMANTLLSAERTLQK